MATLEGRVGGVGYPSTSLNWFHVIKATIDFSALTDVDTGDLADPAAADVVKLMGIPAGFILFGFALNVTEVMGGTGSTITIGDTTQGNVFYPDLDLETLQTFAGFVAGYPITYTADDVLKGTLAGTTATDGTMEIYAFGFRLNDAALLTSV